MVYRFTTGCVLFGRLGSQSQPLPAPSQITPRMYLQRFSALVWLCPQTDTQTNVQPGAMPHLMVSAGAVIVAARPCKLAVWAYFLRKRANICATCQTELRGPKGYWREPGGAPKDPRGPPTKRTPRERRKCEFGKEIMVIFPFEMYGGCPQFFCCP